MDFDSNPSQRYKINREPEIMTTNPDDENNVVQNYRRKSRLTLLEEPPEQLHHNGGRGYFEGAMCKCRNGRLRMDSNGDLHCDYCGFTDVANDRKTYFQAPGPILALSSPERLAPVSLFDDRLTGRRHSYKERIATSRGNRRQRFYGRPAPGPFPSLLKLDVNDYRDIDRKPMKNFRDQPVKNRNGRKGDLRNSRRSSSVESNAESNKSPISDGLGDSNSDTKRRLESEKTDLERTLEQEMKELDQRVKRYTDNKYVGSSNSVVFLCGFYCKICRKMISGNMNDIMATHGSLESHRTLTEQRTKDDVIPEERNVEDDTFDIRFDDDGCILISKLNDNVSPCTDVQPPVIDEDCSPSVIAIGKGKVSPHGTAKNDEAHFTDDEDEREEGETMDDDEEEENNEFEDISEDRERTPEPSRRRRRYDRTSSRRY